jgi:hypothetical protein
MTNVLLGAKKRFPENFTFPVWSTLRAYRRRRESACCKAAK